jgi:hypothetical protein
VHACLQLTDSTCACPLQEERRKQQEQAQHHLEAHKQQMKAVRSRINVAELKSQGRTPSAGLVRRAVLCQIAAGCNASSCPHHLLPAWWWPSTIVYNLIVKENGEAQ